MPVRSMPGGRGVTIRVRLRGINKVRKRLADGGTATYYYHRSTGTRLQGAPGSAEFIASLAAADALGRQRLAGTFDGLIRDFTLSAEFARLAPVTQRDYRINLTFAEREFGSMPLAALEDRRVRADFLAWRDKIAATGSVRAADYRLSAISSMLSWAEDRGKISANHLRGFKHSYHSDRSELIWLPEHVRSFMAVAPVELQRALILALHTGQRQGDLLRLTWAGYDGKAITLRQSKSRRQGKPGRLITVPCTKALRRMLDGINRSASSTQILTMASGKPWKQFTFVHRWRAAANAGGIVGLHFHDLRGTAVTMLAEAGCTAPEIASITGHNLAHVTTILDKYLARTRPLAEAAIGKFERSQNKFANRLQTGRQSAGSKKRK
jgi:integrase